MISINDLITPANGLVIALLESPLHVIASKGLLVLRWSGRRSANEFAIPVGYQKDGDDLIVLISKRSEKNWWKNFSTPWPAEVCVRGANRSVMGEVIPVGSEDFYRHIERTLARLPWMGSQFGGLTYDKQAGLDDEQRRILSENVGAVRFEILG